MDDITARRRASLTVTMGCAIPVLVPLLAGCSPTVKIEAPDKPIEINLNINIRQEVVVRLQQDVRELIDKNPGVF